MKFERNTLLLLGLLAALFPLLVRDQYLLHIGVMVLFYVILASSLNLTLGYIGEFSLGHTAFLGLGAYSSALLATHFHWPLWLTLPAAGLVAALSGALIGAITLRLRGPYFVIITLAFAEALRIVANNWIEVTNGPMGIAGIAQPAVMASLSALDIKRSYYYLALLMAAIALYLIYRFVYSSQGRAAVTVRENRYVAQSVGIWPFAYALKAFVLGAFLAGLAGGLYAHYITFVGVDVFQFSFMVTMIIMVLLGGKSTLVGPVIGALVVTLLSEYLREMQELRMSIFGLIVMAVVLFLPKGLMGFLTQRREQHRRAAAIPATPVQQEKTI
ncbi:branched-chain amino acid ABC transporter permease [[Erwinia] mediterraneensis]|uniref:branched-chain amino acid ABC transporter permease n=1 Tax=[Erwinia] mediterraneensis TaxID=2161819 RepID=UPI001031D9A1|nr:branched-chain amino acid ABC transporter permease [[Erwinia] mediterraneensis]